MKETTGKGQYFQTQDPMIASPPGASPAAPALLKTQPFDYLPKYIGYPAYIVNIDFFCR